MSSWDLLWKGYEKIPLLAASNLRGDYPNELAGEDHTFLGRHGDREFDMSVALGERVRFTKNDGALGVNNGDLATV